MQVWAAVWARVCVSVLHPLWREGCSLLLMPSVPPYVVGQDATTGGKFLGARAEALGPDESHCYCCWKDQDPAAPWRCSELGVKAEGDEA